MIALYQYWWISCIFILIVDALLEYSHNYLDLTIWWYIWGWSSLQNDQLSRRIPKKTSCDIYTKINTFQSLLSVQNILPIILSINIRVIWLWLLIFETCNEEREVVNTDLVFTLWQFTIDERGKHYLIWLMM